MAKSSGSLLFVKEPPAWGRGVTACQARLGTAHSVHSISTTGLRRVLLFPAQGGRLTERRDAPAAALLTPWLWCCAAPTPDASLRCLRAPQAVAAGAADYARDYLPEVDARRRAREDEEAARCEKDLARLRADMAAVKVGAAAGAAGPAAAGDAGAAAAGPAAAGVGAGAEDGEPSCDYEVSDDSIEASGGADDEE
jgi:hypothetical protein